MIEKQARYIPMNLSNRNIRHQKCESRHLPFTINYYTPRDLWLSWHYVNFVM